MNNIHVADAVAVGNGVDASRDGNWGLHEQDQVRY